MKRREGGEPARAAVLASKDKAKRAWKEAVEESSSDSEAEATIAAEARKKRDRELKRTLQENESLERQLADAAAKQKS